MQILTNVEGRGNLTQRGLELMVGTQTVFIDNNELNEIFTRWLTMYHMKCVPMDTIPMPTRSPSLMAQQEAFAKNPEEYMKYKDVPSPDAFAGRSAGGTEAVRKLKVGDAFKGEGSTGQGFYALERTDLGAEVAKAG